ncbi:hypothetical protein [Nocardiopsis sp. LDBS1602]|uniref:hypothetical protein n=1 Tax=Nocardiopsis sp. LDBS1602 TaxID=3109597 RepID=UPI002DBF1F24|nr:hypothetical protein [Nocardiopsis sp. LDBS1602]MEC3895440.1 hypothetical protein [Nocardiopsis sp. LDBS1602]
MVGVLIRLESTLGRHGASGTRGGTLALLVGGAALTWYVTVVASSAEVRSQLLMLLGAVWAGAWILGPTITNGVGVLRPQYFTLLPLERSQVGTGLWATAFVGVGPALTLVAMASTARHAWLSEPATLSLGLLGMLLSVVFMVSLSRLVFRALGAAMHTRVGMEIASVQWGLIVAGLFFGWAAIGPALSAAGDLAERGFPAPVVTVLAALPTSWPIAAVDAAASGAWGAAFGLLGAFTLLTAATVLATVRLLAPRVNARGRGRRSRPLGRRRSTRRLPLLPDGPLGAVVGKELRSWWRDPWRALELRSALYAGLFIGLFGLMADRPWITLSAGVFTALVMAMGGSNMYGHDGSALWLTVVGQGRDTVRADVRGRQIAIALLIVPGTLLLGLVSVLVSGEPDASPYVLAGLLVVLGVGNGLSVLLSVVAATPGVEPHLRVDANDTGDTRVQVWTSLIAIPPLSSPTIVVALLAGGWWAVPVALVNGAAGAWLLGRLAHRRLAARLPETFARIRYGGRVAERSLPRSGGDPLDLLERTALSTNEDTRPTGS